MRDAIHRISLGVAASCSFKRFLNNHLRQWALRSQLFWIINGRGEIAMDFIGRFERLQEDFSHICGVLQIEDSNLPKLIGGDDSGYVQHYDSAMIDVIANRFRQEIAIFGFEFGE